MAESSPLTKETFLDLSDEEILTQLAQFAKFKQRSHQTHHNIHIPELNFRLNLGLDSLGASTRDEGSTETQDSFAPVPDLSNKSPVEVVYLGNSMLERLKTTGKDTNLGKLRLAFNAGCGGDKTENVAYRVEQGLYSHLKTAQAKQQEEQQQERNCNIKLWILASGTNNLHPKRPFRKPDVESYKALVKACLRIAPRSKVLACDMFYRMDVAEEIVEKGNEMLMGVVEELNREMKEENRSDGVDENIGEDKVVWMEARKLIGRDMFVDHVHLNEEGYAVWDGVLWPWVEKMLGF